MLIILRKKFLNYVVDFWSYAYFYIIPNGRLACRFFYTAQKFQFRDLIRKGQVIFKRWNALA